MEHPKFDLALHVMFWRRLFFILGALFLFTHLVLLVTHRLYIYKALRYTYAGIDDEAIFPTDTIASGTAVAWPASKAYNQGKLPSALDADLVKYQSVAFLAIHCDSLLHEIYWDGSGPNVRTNPFSVTKSLVSILVGIAIDEGKIPSVDQPLSVYFPQFEEDSLGRFLTIRHLVNMSAGFNFDENYGGLFSMTTRAYYDDDLSRIVKDLRIIEKPGVRFHYQSSNQILLGAILEKVTGKRLSEYASEKLWKPIGAEHMAVWSLDHEGGLPKAFCCWYTCARDLAKVGNMMLNGGVANGKRIVSKTWVEESTSLAKLRQEDGQGLIDHYGFSWWLTSYQNHRVFYGRGLDGQYLICVPDYSLVLVRFGHERNPNRHGEHMDEVPQFIDGIVSAYQLKPTATPDSSAVQ